MMQVLVLLSLPLPLIILQPPQPLLLRQPLHSVLMIRVGLVKVLDHLDALVAQGEEERRGLG